MVDAGEMSSNSNRPDDNLRLVRFHGGQMTITEDILEIWLITSMPVLLLMPLWLPVIIVWVGEALWPASDPPRDSKYLFKRNWNKLGPPIEENTDEPTRALPG
jgi:hypothetical protein